MKIVSDNSVENLSSNRWLMCRIFKYIVEFGIELMKNITLQQYFIKITGANSHVCSEVSKTSNKNSNLN